MKKIYFLLLFVSILAINAKAQVIIGSQDAPTEGAVLELKSTNLGFLPTRVALEAPSKFAPLPAHVQGMVVYNTAVTDSLKVGLYYNTGSKWVALSAEPFTKENWFYMPSIPIDVTVTSATEINLWAEYQKQLNANGALVIPSDGAPAHGKVLVSVPGPTDLYYYVTAYDDSVFENISITADGKMTYSVKTGAMATDATFLNIVFVEK